jgi:hypothetical protein
MTVITHTHFIVTPGIELLPNYFVIQNLIRERIRNVIMGVPNVDFKVLAEEFVVALIPAPEFQDDDKRIKYQAWLKKETEVVYKAFTKYEENKQYQDSIAMLRTFQGQMFSVSSVTIAGIMVVLSDPNGKLA